MKKKYFISKKELIDLYKDKNMLQISSYLNWPKTVIERYFKTYNIPRRSRSAACIMRPQNSEESRKRQGKTISGKNHPMYGKKRNFSEETRRKIGKQSKRNWQNPDFIKKINNARMKSLNIKPNKPEKTLGKLLGKDYKFVGDGKLWIERYNPDFINCNGEKKIVEMFGDYWHNLDDYKIRDKRRKRIYKQYGYKTLIIWEKELKDIKKLLSKVQGFINV